MRSRKTVLTRKGQITVPVEMRRALGLREGDKVVCTLEGDEVRVTRFGSVVERTAGIIKSRGRPPTERELKESAEQAIADDVYERMNR
jgi:AbrB family looped-hinge helix DNA binding protein